MENQRNLILAIVLSALVLIGWTVLSERFLPKPAAAPSTRIVDGKQVPLPKPESPLDTPAKLRDRAVVLAESPRVSSTNHVEVVP